MKILAGQGHAATALIGAGRRLAQPQFKCDCGNLFAAYRPLVGIEPDHYESPQWEQHVRNMRKSGL